MNDIMEAMQAARYLKDHIIIGRRNLTISL